MTNYEPGTLAVARGDGLARIVLVTHDDGTHLRALLCTNIVEAATDIDTILDGFTPYRLLVHGELYGCLWHRQIARAVARVPVEVVRSCFEALVSDGEANEHLPHGLPLQGPPDPRWRFKEIEGDEWRRMTADCTRTLLGWDDG